MKSLGKIPTFSPGKGTQQLDREADTSPPTSAETKNVRLLMCHHGAHSDNLTFLCIGTTRACKFIS